MPISKYAKQATPIEAERGIYLDFEGRENESPALVGVLVEGRIEQFVLDTGLAAAATVKGLVVRSLEDEIRNLLELSTADNRCLFGFTQHELNIVRDYTSLGARFEEAYKDSHKIARRWVHKCRPDETTCDWSLKNLATLIDFPRKKHLGNHTAAKRIKDVRDALRKWQDYKKITPCAKRKWTNLLTYNRWDCEAMRALTITAARELAE